MGEDKYPISEIFTSWQGEGLWAGTRMTFIRFAGCNVGKPIYGDKITKPAIDVKATNNYGIIPIWQTECTLYDGRKFLCDTDYRVKERLTAKEVIDRVPSDVVHLCFTGGEPLLRIEAIENIMMEHVKQLDIKRFVRMEKIFHIETSGTILFDYSERSTIWITVSPKNNYLPQMIQRANEVKFLVDINFNEKDAEDIASLDNDGDTIFWLSPINSVNELDKTNMDLAKNILERHSNWRLTQQSHKIWSVR